MNAKDLMKGDWILCSEEGWNSDNTKWAETNPRKITAIDRWGVMVENEDEEEYKVSYEQIESIPLTPEILGKNGFHFGYTADEEDMAACVSAHLDPNGKGWVWDEGAGAIKVQFPNDCDGGQIFIYGDNYLTMVFDEIFVHQLQHILNLCGIGKVIIL